jgi:hypothetical protein
MTHSIFFRINSTHERARRPKCKETAVISVTKKDYDEEEGNGGGDDECRDEESCADEEERDV